MHLLSYLSCSTSYVQGWAEPPPVVKISNLPVLLHERARTTSLSRLLSHHLWSYRGIGHRSLLTYFAPSPECGSHDRYLASGSVQNQCLLFIVRYTENISPTAGGWLDMGFGMRPIDDGSVVTGGW